MGSICGSKINELLGTLARGYLGEHGPFGSSISRSPFMPISRLMFMSILR